MLCEQERALLGLWPTLVRNARPRQLLHVRVESAVAAQDEHRATVWRVVYTPFVPVERSLSPHVDEYYEEDESKHNLLSPERGENVRLPFLM